MDDQQAKRNQEKKAVNNDRLKRAIEDISRTPEGREFFKWMAKRCHFTVSTVVGDPNSHEINVYGTMFNEAQRRIYLEIRRDIPSSERRRIEIPMPKEER